MTLPWIRCTHGFTREAARYLGPAPGCVPFGDIRALVTEPPEHGSVQLRETSGYHHALPGAATASCNGRRVAGLQPGYVSHAAYRGPDAFAAEVVFPDGTRSSIPVRATVR